MQAALIKFKSQNKGQDWFFFFLRKLKKKKLRISFLSVIWKGAGEASVELKT